MSWMPSYASIREWLTADVEMRKDLSQRLLWSRLKTLRLKLRRVPSNLIREYPSDAATKLACAQPDFLKSVSSRAALNRACNAIPTNVAIRIAG
jgi:hypothetical protein